MSIKRYLASQDASITNAYKDNLSTRATASNTGESDSLEVFSIYGQSSATSLENSRILVQFPIEKIASDRTDGKIPAAGSVGFYLKLGNAVHPNSLPKKFTLVAESLSRQWEEGHGLDMESYLDLGSANWISASVNTAWTTPGGDYNSSPYFTQYFEKGSEDLQMNVTSLVEQWIDGTKANYGLGIRLTASQETGSASVYTKKFFARNSEYFFKRPYIEARFDSSKKDGRRSFFNSSSLAPAEDNLNLIYLYNRHKGKLVDIPAVGKGLIYVSLYSGSNVPLGNRLVMHKSQTVITGGYIASGTYTASVAINTTFDHVYDIWHNDGGTDYVTGSKITIVDPTEETNPAIPDYVINISNLKPTYSSFETARFNLHTREKNWSPTIYTVATNNTNGISVEDAYYKIIRIVDNLEVIPFGTGSYNETRLSLDTNGNYFDLPMDLLEPNYAYGIKFAFKNSGYLYEQKNIFKFRLD